MSADAQPTSKATTREFESQGDQAPILLALIVVAAWPCMDCETVLLLNEDKFPQYLGFDNWPGMPPPALILSNLNFILTALV
jgi:hypothetical protein